MAYSAQADLQAVVGGLERLTDLTDWDGVGAINGTATAAMTAAIAEADDLIDSFGAKVYHVPFNPVPPIITTTSAQLAVIILRRRRQMAGASDEMRWEQLAGMHGWLFQLATGVVTPGGDPLPQKHGTMAPDTASDDPPADREISRHKLSGFW